MRSFAKCCVQKRAKKGAPHNQQIGEVAQFTNESAEVTVRNHVPNERPVKHKRNLPGAAAPRMSCAPNARQSVTLRRSHRRMSGTTRDDEGGVFATSACSEYFRFRHPATPRARVQERVQQVFAVCWLTSLANERCVRGLTTHPPRTPQQSVYPGAPRTKGSPSAMPQVKPATSQALLYSFTLKNRNSLNRWKHQRARQTKSRL